MSYHTVDPLQTLGACDSDGLVRWNRSVTSGIRVAKASRFIDEDKCPQTRYIDVTLAYWSDRGEPEQWTEDSVLKPVTDAVTCVDARILSAHLFTGRVFVLLVVRRAQWENWGRGALGQAWRNVPAWCRVFQAPRKVAPMVKIAAVVPEEQPFILLNLSPGRAQRRLALAVVLAFLVSCFITTGPLSTLQPGRLDVIPPYATAMIVNDSITAVLLFAQFSILRSRAILVIASGYLFTALMLFPWMLTFPGVVTPGGLLGAGLQSTNWLYILWHAGFADGARARKSRRHHGPAHGLDCPRCQAADHCGSNLCFGRFALAGRQAGES